MGTCVDGSRATLVARRHATEATSCRVMACTMSKKLKTCASTDTGPARQLPRLGLSSGMSGHSLARARKENVSAHEANDLRGAIFPTSVGGAGCFAQFAQLQQFRSQAMPQRAFGTKILDQRLGFRERILANRIAAEQLTPTSGDFLFGEQAQPLDDLQQVLDWYAFSPLAPFYVR